MFYEMFGIVLIVGIISVGIYGLFELFVRKKERMLLIEKMCDKPIIPECEGKLRLPNYGSMNFSFSALKFGFLLLGMGLGLLVGYLIAFKQIPGYGYAGWDDTRHLREVVATIYCSCLLLFGGLGLVAAFVVEIALKKTEAKKSKDNRIE